MRTSSFYKLQHIRTIQTLCKLHPWATTTTTMKGERRERRKGILDEKKKKKKKGERGWVDMTFQVRKKGM